MRVSCDSVVALGSATRSGRTIFAKNSDRPAAECQPLIQIDAAEHDTATPLRCQYIEIEQVQRTNAFIGARPHWLWGVEHGVNEHGVAIGNHTIFTRDPVADVGLTGMDLVRLGLERAASAAGALEVIVSLVERHGQGGSGFVDTVWPYHNSFLIADRGEAYLLEASARNWAWRRVSGVGSATNHVTIGDDWDAISESCERHAREQGWWNNGRRFDFAAAYRDTTVVPPIVSSARYAATCAALRDGVGRLDRAAVMRLMRDHNDGQEVYRPIRTPDDAAYYSVCMHADPVGTTTASMVAELSNDREAPTPVWVAFCNPCISPYLPIFLEGRLPEPLCTGDADPESGGAWWRFKHLLSRVEANWNANGERVRDAWRAFEQELDASLGAVLETAAARRGEARRLLLTRYMHELWEETEARLDRLLGELS